tara:strand:+ start:699 stop:1508 length:810 start_codon:yes stop_codon:yes gene_type:complete
MTETMKTLPPPSPGEVLRDVLAERDISQSQAAQALRMSRGHLNSIINGHNPFSADLKLKLQDFLGLPPSHWSQVQETHDQFAASPTGREHLQKKSTEALLDQWELRGPRLLVDHEIEDAVNAGYLDIPNFDAERLNGTTYELRLSDSALVVRQSDPDAGEVSVPLKPRFLLQTGQVATLRLAERIKLPSRVRGLLVGAADGLGGPGAPVYFDPVVTPGFEGSLVIQIENRSPRPLQLQALQSAVLIEFSFLADEPVRRPSPIAPSTTHE